MSQQLRLQTNATPSYINKDLLLGGLLGGLAILPLGIIGVGVAAVAALGGAYLGKKRLEHESREGKIVGEPTAWNKDMLIGGLLGLLGAGLAAIPAGLITLGATAAVGAGAPVVLGGTVLAMGAAMVAAPLIGGYIGGKIGKSAQDQEYEDAKRQTIVNHLSATVSPEVGHAVGHSMEHSKDWGKDVAEGRLLAAAAQHHHP